MVKKTRTYQWRDPSRRAAAAIWTLSIGVLILVARAMTTILFGAAADYTNAEEFTGPQWVALLLDLLIILVILACVTVLLWIWRANANGHVFKPKMRFSPLGSIGFYLVPFASLFLPFAAMEEIWLVSQGGGSFKTPPLLRWWWGFLIADGILSMVSGMAARAGLPEPAAFAALNAVTGIVTSVLLIVIIRRVTQMQRDRYATGAPQNEAPTAEGGILSSLASG